MHFKLFWAILDHVFGTLGWFIYLFFIYIPYLGGGGESMEISILFFNPSLRVLL